MFDMNIYEEAIRNQYRFPYKGSITMEDLWKLSILNLDTIYRDLSDELLDISETSLLTDENKDKKINDEINEVNNKMSIVKHIFDVKNSEDEAKKKEKANDLYKKKIARIIADKEEESLKNLSIEQLKDIIKSL